MCMPSRMDWNRSHLRGRWRMYGFDPLWYQCFLQQHSRFIWMYLWRRLATDIDDFFFHIRMFQSLIISFMLVRFRCLLYPQVTRIFTAFLGLFYINQCTVTNHRKDGKEVDLMATVQTSMNVTTILAMSMQIVLTPLVPLNAIVIAVGLEMVSLVQAIVKALNMI